MMVVSTISMAKKTHFLVTNLQPVSCHKSHLLAFIHKMTFCLHSLWFGSKLVIKNSHHPWRKF